MTIIQCKLCRKPFQSPGGSQICGNCLKSMEEDYKAVRDYLDEHPGADIDKVTEETEVSKSVILYFLKEGRLQIGNAEGDNIGGGVLFCEVCKKPIATGKMCDKCKKNIFEKMQRAPVGESQVEKNEKSTFSSKKDAKMHVDHKGR